MPEVRLTTLPVLRRYSLALRQEWADAETLLQALEESVAQVQRSLGTRGDERLREEPTR